MAAGMILTLGGSGPIGSNLPGGGSTSSNAKLYVDEIHANKAFFDDTQSNTIEVNQTIMANQVFAQYPSNTDGVVHATGSPQPGPIVLPIPAPPAGTVPTTIPTPDSSPSDRLA